MVDKIKKNKHVITLHLSALNNVSKKVENENVTYIRIL